MIDLKQAIEKLSFEWDSLTRLAGAPHKLRADADTPKSGGPALQAQLSTVVVGWCVLKETRRDEQRGVGALHSKKFAQTLQRAAYAKWTALEDHSNQLLAREVRDRLNWLNQCLTRINSIMPLEELTKLETFDSDNALGSARVFRDFWPLFSDTRQLLAWAKANAVDPLSMIPPDRCPGTEHLLGLDDDVLDSLYDQILANADPSKLSRPGKSSKPHGFVSFSLAILVPEMLFKKDASSRNMYRVRRLLQWAVNYWSIHIDAERDYGDTEERVGEWDYWAWDETHEFLNANALWQVLSSPQFSPDSVVGNQLALEPLFLTRNLPKPVNARFREAYLAFIHSSYLGTVLLCRAALECALNDRAEEFGIEAKYLAGDRGTYRSHSLADLVRPFSEALPGSEDDLELIKNHGNWIAHPGARKIKGEPEPDITRGMALDSIQATHRILRLIYGMSRKNHTNLN